MAILKAVRNCFFLVLAVPVVLGAILGIVYIGFWLFGPEAAHTDDYTWVKVADGFEAPTDIRHAGDERLFVLGRAGLIYVVDETETVRDEPFLDIRERVDSSLHVEQGLLALAFHPEYSENGYFFVYYTSNDLDVHISRFQVSEDDPNIANPNSEEIVIVIPQTRSTHNGGDLKFGPDGYLYISTGDGTALEIGTGQRLNDLLGKILRIDVEQLPYSIPDDNPFMEVDGARGEIFAMGLRNPWRFSFDSQSHDIFIGDVGASRVEEVNYLPSGESGYNFGWSTYEGNTSQDLSDYNYPEYDRDELTFPLAFYERNWLNPSEIVAEGYYRCAIVGGYTYRGRALPDLVGSYFYTDWCAGLIWRIDTTAEQWESVEWMDTDFMISSFGTDVNGELYITSFGESAIYRLEATS